MPGHDVIVVGGSLGGLDALRALVRALPADLPAAVFVVLHTSPRSPGTLGQILDQAGPLPARLAQHEEAIHPGHIYVAPPDHHLLVKQDVILLIRGPHENRTRPALDPLFRSAAVAYRSRVVGVVLSGMLDDGAAGLLAVKRCGGLTVVQAPSDALYPEMPGHAIEATEVDHILPLSEMGALLHRLAATPAGDPPPVPRDLLIEVQLTENMTDDTERLDEIGEHTSLSCPDCGGVLWMMKDRRLHRYRCHVGHTYTENTLLDGQVEATETALLVALRTMEDRIKMLDRMAREDRGRGHSTLGLDYEARAAELKRHAGQIRKILMAGMPEGEQQEPSL